MCITLDNQARLGRNHKLALVPAAEPIRIEPGNALLPSDPAISEPEHYPSDVEPMDLSTAFRFRGPLSESERRYRPLNNLCNYCGSPGHYANSCPNKHPSPLVLSSACTSAFHGGEIGDPAPC